MRIHRIALRNYRGVEDCEVPFAGEGVTIVEGDNEIGKTSLTEALDLALRELDSSSKERVRATQPAGRDVGPEVEVEISSGAYRLKLRKRWRRRPETRLEVTEPQHELHTGREAHQRLRSILDETLDWGLWEALQVAQGAELRLPVLGVASLGSALGKEAGDDAASYLRDALWEQICNERAVYWTNTGLTNKERKESAATVQEAQERLSSLESSLRDIDDDIDEYANLTQEHARLKHDLGAARQSESELSARSERIGTLRNDASARSAAHREALSQQAQRNTDMERRAELVSDLERADEALTTLRDERQLAAPMLDAADRRAKKATTELDNARDAWETAVDSNKLASDDRDHHRRLIEIAQFRERLERTGQAQIRLAEAESAMADVRIDSSLVEQIDEAHLAVVRAEASVEAAAAHVTTTALRDVTVTVDSVDHDLRAGDQHDLPVSDIAELQIGDDANVRIRAGQGSAATARQLQEARLELRRLCDEGGVADLASAHAADKSRELAERERDSARVTIKENLRDLTHEELTRMAERHDRRIAEYIADRAPEPRLPENLREATVLATNSEATVETCRASVVASEKVVARAEKALATARLDAAESGGKLVTLQQARDQAARSLDDARQQISDEALVAALAKADEVLTSAETSADAAQEALEQQDADVVDELLANARDTSQRLNRELGENGTRQHELHGRLEARGEMGLATRRDDAESELRRVRRDHENTERRALAVECLHRAFETRRREARQRYLAPFREGIERLGRVVFDSPTFKVELDEDLGIARRTLDGVTLDVAQLSTGAREQLGIIARLACAAIVSADGGGAPVVLDDALGWSDPSRLRRMGAAIAAAGKSCQVIILTCTPGRYAHVGNAAVVSLPTSSQSERS